MGLNMDGLSPELRKKVQKLIVDDGKISSKEFLGLSEAEQNQLTEALGGFDKVKASLDETGDYYNLATENRLEQAKWVFKKDENNETSFWDRDIALAEAKKDYYLNNDKTSTWDKIKNWGEHQLQDAGIVVAGTLVALGGGKLLKPLGKVGGKLLNALKGAKMPTAGQVAKTTAKSVVVGGAAVGIVACGKIDTPTPSRNVTINNVLNFTFSVKVDELTEEEKKSLFETLKMLVELQKESNKNEQEINNNLQTTIEKLARIINLLVEQGNTLGDIAEGLHDAGIKLDNIINILSQMGKTQEEILKALLSSGQKLDEIIGAFNDLGYDLDEIKKIVKGIYQDTGNILKTNTDIYNKLQKIIEKITTFEPVDYQNELKPIIEAAIQQLINTYNAGNDKVLQKLQEILTKIPEKCDCKASEILMKLEIIIETLQNSDSSKHEGILDDLDDLFG